MSLEDFLAFLYGKKSGDYPDSWNAAPDFGCASNSKPW